MPVYTRALTHQALNDEGRFIVLVSRELFLMTGLMVAGLHEVGVGPAQRGKAATTGALEAFPTSGEAEFREVMIINGSCLMERDNALFGQLLGLHQSIAELRREASQPAATTSSAQKPPSRPASLESLASSSSSSEPGCRRCSVAGGQLRRRRALSQTYDSGVQLHYGSSHSESDHEVFV
ncbi:hypothetical protein HPB51_014856 [Rhipicephalus microplus]|uniref:Uncharacterized protein n=1 Tax=Rhipicephalus microplus TaxID=6941 RepID=A0A9J6DN74_RHIMP|nr:hypothetical protein HPB51_014856 [Rhipicephalus microplus]